MGSLKSFIIIAAILVAFCLSIPAFAENTSPDITSVIPDRAEAGDTITINGENPGIAGDEVEVNFGLGVKVKVSPGGSSLSCTVPVGAETGEISLKITRIRSEGMYPVTSIQGTHGKIFRGVANETAYGRAN